MTLDRQSGTAILSAEQKNMYERDGILHLALPPEVDAVRRQFLGEACQWLATMGGMKIEDESQLGVVLADLARRDRALVGKLYKVSRRFPAAKLLATHPWCVRLAGEMMKTDLVSCCHFVNVRIDLPDEERYLTPEHQDFPYIQGSLNGVTVWIPFLDTPAVMGPPSWIPASHRWGMLGVREFGLDEVGGSGGRSFEIVETEQLRSGHFINGDVPAGTALAFSTLLVHRSESNPTNSARLNIQVRFDDALAAESFERNYPEGLFLGNRLAATYPEYVRNVRS